METRANHLLVGSFVLAIIAGAVIFVLWLARFQFDEQFTRYDIVFSESVSGLKPGASVELKGIPVGEVTGIRLDPETMEKVRVTIEVPADTPIKEDTRANMQIKGITGGLAIQLSGGSEGAPPLRAAPGQPRPVIPSQPSAIDQFLAGAPELMDGIRNLVARASLLLSEENQQSITQTLRNTAALTGALAERTDDFGLLITDASQTMGNLREASAELKEMSASMQATADRVAANVETTLTAMTRTVETVDGTVSDARPDIRKILEELRSTSAALNRGSQEFETMVAENRPAIRDFTGEGLYQFTAFINEARTLINTLERLTTQVESDPARFLFGDRQRGYETRN